MKRLEHNIPPLMVVLCMGGLGWLFSRCAPSLGFVLPHRKEIVLLLIAAGFCVVAMGVVNFKRAKTTLNPLSPENASALVTTGIYQHTRNPMYLGMLLLLAGWVSFMENLLSFASLPGFVLYMNRFQIQPEERALAGVFGENFTAYQSKVRRWL